MDVSVLSKHGQRSLRSAAMAGILGNGLLERARSTTLALLGMAAAVGLATVALALNQDWPLIPGAPIPGLGGGHEAVGQAVSVPGSGARETRAAPLPSVEALSSAGRPGASGGRRGIVTAVKGARAPKGAHLVVSAPTPVSPGESPAGNEVTNPVPAAPQPSPAPPAEPVVASAPAAAGDSTPAASAPPSQASPESPTTSKKPQADEEDDQDSGHDRGHHYGEGAGRGHGHSRGGDDSGAGEVDESPEVAPAPSDGSTPESEAGDPEGSEDDHSRASSWGHGGSHGHGHW